MYLLQKIAPPLGIGLISPGKPADGSAVSGVGLLEQCVLAAAIHRCP
jgi:hypothetical protein